VIFFAFERGKQDNVDMRKSLGPLIFLPIVIASLTEEIGTLGGDIRKAELPDYFEVEYVRVYEMSR